MVNKFPNLIEIMAITRTKRTNLADVIDKFPAAITNKLEGKTEFKQSEMSAIVTYFKKLTESSPDLVERYPVITGDIIFYENDHYSDQE